jgi:hypothetical protein
MARSDHRFAHLLPPIPHVESLARLYYIPGWITLPIGVGIPWRPNYYTPSRRKVPTARRLEARRALFDTCGAVGLACDDMNDALADRHRMVSEAFVVPRH